MDAGAVLVAAGSGTRAGCLKQFESLAGRPLFTWALATLASSERLRAIVVVVPSGFEVEAANLSQGLSCGKDVRFAIGGQRRRDSVLLGLQALPPCEWVLVHDAARPLLTLDLVDQALEAARGSGAASVGTPVTDTLKRVDSDGRISETVARDGLWAVQTPQAFRTDLLLRAHQQDDEDAPDDASLVERVGGQVVLFEGPRTNIKVTRMEDFDVAEALMRARTDG